MVDAENGEAVKGYVLDEVSEGGLKGLEVAVVIEVFGIDVGDHRHGRTQLQESAVALVGLDDDPFALADFGVGAVSVDDPAVDHGRIEPSGVEKGGDQGRRRGLAVGPPHRDGEQQAHQFGQHLGAPHQGDPGCARRRHLGVLRPDGAGIDDGGGAHDVIRVVTDEHLCAQGT